MISWQAANLRIRLPSAAGLWTITIPAEFLDEGKTQAELKQILKAGQGNITVTLSLSNTTGISSIRSDAKSGVYYSLNGQRIEKPTHGIYQ